jgi:hypothetical protein
MMRPFPEGLYRVCSAFEVEKLTAEGWRIADILNESELISNMEMVPAPVPQGGYSNGQTVSVTRYHRVQVHKYLLHREAASVLADQAAKLLKLTQQVDQLTKDRKAAEVATGEMTKKLGVAEANVKRLADERDEIRKIGDVNTAKVRRMEEDFGKVWQGVGETGMRQILGTEAVNPKPAPPDQRRTAYERLTSNEE